MLDYQKTTLKVIIVLCGNIYSVTLILKKKTFTFLTVPNLICNLTELGNAKNVEQECQKYEEDIKKAGGIELFLGGIGTDGHIAFNEPGSSLVFHEICSPYLFHRLLVLALDPLHMIPLLQILDFLKTKLKMYQKQQLQLVLELLWMHAKSYLLLLE